MKKIAVIEDDELLNKALVITLEKEGYQVTAGKSCRDGIALLQNNPDLMLVDINLPDGNGISICREAERFSKIPVLFLTARVKSAICWRHSRPDVMIMWSNLFR